MSEPTCRPTSSTEPDWSRETKALLAWAPSRSLLASIRAYQRHRGSLNPIHIVLRVVAVLRHRFWSVVTGADIPVNCQLGGGLLMPHPTGIVIHPNAVIGPNCLIFQQVTLGVTNGAAPTAGGHVDFGAGAKVLGAIRIGDHVQIGANAVVLSDVPSDATVVGIPARIIERRKTEHVIVNAAVRQAGADRSRPAPSEKRTNDMPGGSGMSEARSLFAFRSLWATALVIYPGRWNPHTVKPRLSFLLTCMLIRPRLEPFLNRPESGLLREDMKIQPSLWGFVRWPYVDARWSIMRRFEALAEHRRAVGADMIALDMPVSGFATIADLSTTAPGLTLIVDRAAWFLREGSLVLNLFLNGERLMSLAFSFGRQRDQRIVYVGSVQGSNVDSALEKYRAIAKDLQGMRSRDFLIKAFQFLMYHMGVKQILCVSDEYRHHRHSYFGRSKGEKLHLNYDEIWRENGGELGDDGFYRLPSLPRERPLAEIAAKNRALYRRRYEMMTRFYDDIGARFGKPVTRFEPREAEMQGTNSGFRPN